MANVKRMMILLLAAAALCVMPVLGTAGENARGMNPATGDETQLGLLIGLMAVCLVGIVVLLVLMKKRSKDD